MFYILVPFVRAKSFRKKSKQAWNYLDSLISLYYSLYDFLWTFCWIWFVICKQAKLIDAMFSRFFGFMNFINVFKKNLWIFQNFYLGQCIPWYTPINHEQCIFIIYGSADRERVKQFSATIKINWSKSHFYIFTSLANSCK